ncbi:MAG: hypothetical protein A2078_11345 [Nitrospirae bacterium GWC2_57_9]|nr:MAG: hypothetical protein A2078_11345 [Nitrospirae bacterium GWC2_57_9]
MLDTEQSDYLWFTPIKSRIDQAFSQPDQCPSVSKDITNKKILIITYHFPPSAAIGGLRLARFAKFLPAFNWTPVVLTIQDRYIENVDEERLRDVSGVTIIKTQMLPTLRGLYLKMKSRYARFRASGPAAVPPDEPGDTAVAGPERLLRKLKRYFISLFLVLPDEERGWALPAIVAAVREVRRRGIDCILTSCPPYSSHLVGLATKKLTGAAWVADFRDPWMTPNAKLSAACALSNRIEAWLEKKVIRNADVVIFTVDRLREHYREVYAAEPADKFVCIPNGLDLVFFPPATLQKYEIFTLCYTGSLYYGRTPEPVFKAVRRLLEQNRVRLEEIRIRLAGHCRQVGKDPVEELIRAYGLDRIVQVSDSVPRMQALEMVRKSHVALLFAPSQPYQIPAKVYDYLALGATILAIAEPGATSDFIRLTGCGKGFLPSDTAGMAEFIYDAMHRDNGNNERYSRTIPYFDAKLLTQSLADILNSLAPGRAPSAQ